MPNRNIIVVGASTGGVEALVQMARDLPANFKASVLVVSHFPPGGVSVLPRILSRAGKLVATHAQNGEHFQPGHIYIAPPDRHLVLGPEERMFLTREARENHHRPAIDPLFRTAARFYGPRVIGIILTGALNDGSAGLMAIRAAGGLAVVQDPNDALVAAMPQNAAELAGADYRVPISEMGSLITRLTSQSAPAKSGEKKMDPIEKMPDTVQEAMAEQIHNQRRGLVSVFSCPECGGTLWQVDQANPRFRCHVGHAYNGVDLLADQSVTLEAALWSAVRGFREKAILCNQLARGEGARGNGQAAERFREQAQQATEYGELIVKHVLQADPGHNPGPPNAPVQDSTP